MSPTASTIGAGCGGTPVLFLGLKEGSPLRKERPTRARGTARNGSRTLGPAAVCAGRVCSAPLPCGVGGVAGHCGGQGLQPPGPSQ